VTRSAWLGHFGLTTPPFSKDVADAQLWLPTSRKDIVEQLVDAVHERHHVLLVGEPGVGKTCTLRAVRHRLPEAGFRLTYCQNATLGRRDFYRQLCVSMGLAPKATAAAVFHAINTHVEELGRERMHPVFLLDEAHLLHQDVLEHLHILANYEWDSKPLLSIVLVGLPDLWGKLTLAKNRSLWSRIHARFSLGQATPEDSMEYIEHRMNEANAKSQVFSSDAFTLIHEATQGRLRDIDRVATLALKQAARRKLKIVDRDLITRVLEHDARPDLR